MAATAPRKSGLTKMYKATNVFEESLARIGWLFDEFPNVIVSMSGGKDSTVIYELALRVAEERGRLPLKVMWLDQEAEWQGTVDYVRSVMHDPRVDPFWYQLPFDLFNAASTSEHWLRCWDPDAQGRWVHPQDPVAIKENRYGTTRFVDLLEQIPAVEYPDEKVVYLTGTRTEESPSRLLGLTHYPAYKWATWGKAISKDRGHYTMSPIYDWSCSDVWKAIHENGWAYNRIYDAQHQHGVPVTRMRVSNLHHETAVHSLFYLQEVEPETYERLVQRLDGIDAAGKLGKDDFFARRLPYMFPGWREYRDFLLERLITDPDHAERMARAFKRCDARYLDLVGEKVYRAEVQSIITTDWELVKLQNFERSPELSRLWRAKRARILETADPAEMASCHVRQPRARKPVPTTEAA